MSIHSPSTLVSGYSDENATSIQWFFLGMFFFLGIYTLFVAGYSYENALVSYKSNPQLGIIGDLSQIHHDYG